jgi:bifunctional DNA-binding transcriptional regulator/antitoxin component of YhaV-PrlF toxin-antitoxin module
MAEISNHVRALSGNESLLLIFPKEVTSHLKIEHEDLLEYSVQDNKLIVKRIDLELDNR